MKRINLRNYYPFYTSDCFVEVSDEVAAVLQNYKLYEAAYRMRTYRHRAFYSLDRDDGIQRNALFRDMLPDELCEHRATLERLYAALASLPDKQAKRIYAHYFLGLSKARIAQAEGVNVNAVKGSISRGLKNLEKFLKKPL